MKTSIVAKVKINLDDPLKTIVIVRKVEQDDEGNLLGIYGLTGDGRWLRKPEGGRYPDECHLPIAVFDNFSPMSLGNEE